VNVGERWTREQLTDLRASHFAPRAWCRFLAASFERAAAARRERRRAQRQVLAVAAAGFLPWVAAAALGAVPLAVVGAGWWTLVVLMLEWHLGMLDDLDRLGPANVLALARAAAVPAVLLLPVAPAAAVFLAAGATDGVDGALARSRRETTRLGFWLDGTTDTLLLGAAAVAALRAGLLPWWAAAAVLVRYALPWPLAAALYFLRGEMPRRRVSGRIPGLAVFAGLAVAMLGGPGASLAAAGAAAGTLTALLSVTRMAPVPSPTAIRAARESKRVYWHRTETTTGGELWRRSRW
jgi:phosphatidylglycerophosphate synthase